MTDPDAQAVAEAIRERCYVDKGSGRVTDGSERIAQVAVDAYRRQVLASRPDVERPREDGGVWGSYVAYLDALLAALADETAARKAAEADRDRLAEQVRRVRALAEKDHRDYPEEGRVELFLWPRTVRAALDGWNPDGPAVDEETKA